MIDLRDPSIQQYQGLLWDLRRGTCIQSPVDLVEVSREWSAENRNRGFSEGRCCI
jgi:hypothetical protein